MKSTNQNKVWMSYYEAVKFLTSNEPFESLENEDLDVLYFHIFQRKSYHMSRAGFINSLTNKRNETKGA